MVTLLRFAAAMGVTVLAGHLVLGAMSSQGVASIDFAVILNAVLTIWIFVVFMLALPQFPPAWFVAYFTPRAWERQGNLYRYLGVLPFQTFLKVTHLGRPRKSDYRVLRERAFLESMDIETRAAETAHGICSLVILGFAIHAAWSEGILATKWMIATGIICQVYPMMLQRCHRPRWHRLLAKLDRTNRNRDEVP